MAGHVTITLDKGGGTGGTSSFYYRLDGGGFYADSALTTQIDSIEPPAGDGVFRGYFLDGGLAIDADGRFTDQLRDAEFTQNIRLGSLWLGGCRDYFGVASESLVPFESDEGLTRARVVTRHYGRNKAGGDSTGAAETSTVAWRNPTVKYMVVGDMTLRVTLGKAFGSSSGKTGYMITSVFVETAHRRFPVVTIQGTANEGADAINRFGVSVTILARARPQNLRGAVSGGGELQACTLLATCDPVVLAEGLRPCASDVVGGRYELRAETRGPAASAPAVTGNFVLLGAPEARAGVEYTRYRLAATAEISAS